MFGELTSKQIEEVLHSQVVGRLGCHADNLVYVVPISYAYDGESIYGRTYEGMKIQMMRKNPEICFEVDTMQNMANWQSVIAWGTFEELTDTEGRRKALEQLHARILPVISSATTQLSSEWPFLPADLNSIKGVVFRIRLVKKTGRFETGHIPFFLHFG